MLEPLLLTRIVSTPAALDTADIPAEVIVLRTAPDEALVLADSSTISVDDPHAIIVDDTGWHGAWMSWDQAIPFLQANCAWELPAERPSMAQGRVADAPAKLWLEDDRMLIVVPHVMARDVADRMGS